MRFSTVFITCMTVTLVCAGAFGMALDSAYPDGLQIINDPESGTSQVRNAWFLGLAMGACFIALIYTAMTLCVWLLNKLETAPLAKLLGPLLAACLSSFGLSAICFLAA